MYMVISINLSDRFKFCNKIYETTIKVCATHEKTKLNIIM